MRDNYDALIREFVGPDLTGRTRTVEKMSIDDADLAARRAARISTRRQANGALARQLKERLGVTD